MFFSKKTLAYAAILLFVSIIGFSFMFVKIAIRYASPFDVLAYRFTFAFLIALVPLIFGWVKVSLDKKVTLRVLPIAIFHPFLYFLVQALGLVYLSSSEAGIIQATLPIFTLILAALILKERTTWVQKAAIFISAFGIVFIFVMTGIQFGQVNWHGVIFMLVSTFSHACYNVMARKTTQQYKMVDITYVMIITGFVSFNLLALGNHLIHGTITHFIQPLFHPLFVLSVLSLGAFASFFSFFLSNFALSELEAGKMGVFSNLTTLIAVFAGILILHEQLYYYHFIGAIFVILGVLGVNLAVSPRITGTTVTPKVMKQ
ncbi:DMT family transporter [Bacillus sp. 03113]|uniref:DMT family transporter n=1 Tax=Bacillus sp. 03113 TaxID=2578211 RepID=UPI001142CEB4|nr:DMT family transporter [Bacillus sp. 03113]